VRIFLNTFLRVSSQKGINRSRSNPRVYRCVEYLLILTRSIFKRYPII